MLPIVAYGGGGRIGPEDEYFPPMSGYAAFLRGINVGRAHRVGSAELRTCFEGLGLRDVSTFRTSGNVAFDAGREPAEKLTARIEEGLEAALGYPVAVFLRTGEEMRAISANEPFGSNPSGGKLQVSMLQGRPSAAARKQVLALATDDDRLAFGDRELYWLPKGGTQESALDLKAIDELLGVSTMRTKGTVEQMTAKFFAA
jgi:uncharacterized protein (DUF1697 family)